MGCRDVATEFDEIGVDFCDLATEVDETGGCVAIWPRQLMRMNECRDMEFEVDDTGEDVVMWPPMLMRLERMT